MNDHLMTSVLLLLLCTIIGRTGVYSTFTNEFVANIEGGLIVADRLAARYGYINFGEMDHFPDHYVFHHSATAKRSIHPSRGSHTSLQHEKAVNWIEQQKIKKRVKRDDEWINDPNYRQQWYMNRKDAPTMNVEAAWEMGYTGKGIVVSILDDGIDYTHPDLARNYDPLASSDINGHDADPMPRANYDQTNRHGTRCAGEIVMEAGNHICGVGVAYNASIGGIRMLDGEVTDKVEGDSLAIQRHHIDIYSASWGPEDNAMTVDGPGRLAKKSFHDGIMKGRNGKGNIFVWASGNGGRAKDNCGCDGYTNSIYTISVSSTSERGEAPWYLEECASTLATTYSSGSPKDRKVTTTDLEGQCTDEHTGTSASAPMAAGLCALALQANTNMTWRDMQYVIVMTSHNSSLNDGEWLVNDAGYSFSHRYGFGLMDAGAMVHLARNWINLPEQLSCTLSSADLAERPREIRGRGLLARFTLSAATCGSGPAYLEHVQAAVSVAFGSRGALVLTLVSPRGTRSRLLAVRPKDRRKGSFSGWPFMSTHFWGESARGEWTLEVENGSPKSNSGQFRGWDLTLYGTNTLPATATPPKRPAPGQVSEKTRQGSKSPSTKKTDHSRLAVPRSSDYASCHSECFHSCSGPLASDCWKCLHYRDRNTDECVPHCPDGYYDPPEVHTRCKACAFSCQTCSGPSASDCLSCSQPLFLMERWSTCVQECAPKFYKDIESSTCVPCAPLCSECEGSADYCQACEPHAMLSSGHACQSSCATNEYLEGNTCKSCHSTCHTCSGSRDNDCLSCVPGSVLKEWACVEEWMCTDGYYVERAFPDEGKECLRCHVSCKNCEGQSSSDCTECNTGSVLQEGACIPNCLDGYYKDGNDDCRTCSYGCDQCTDDSTCVKCAPEFVLVAGTCKQGCTDGSYEHEGSCLNCHSLCETCIGGGPEECTRCKQMESDQRYLLEGACVPFCPEGRYEDPDTLRCEDCDETCKTCNGSEFNRCQSCYEGFRLSGVICQEEEGQHCDPAKCKECVVGYQDRCRACETGKYLQGYDCVDHCAAGYFADDSKDECVHCNPSCETCRGASSQECTSCKEYQFLYDDSTCDNHCPYTTYPDSDGTCKDCHPSCESCSGPGRSKCETCEGGSFWYDNQCLVVCPSGTYGDQGEQECMECYPSCLTCDGPLSVHCVTCIAGLELSGSSCMQGHCSQRTYKDSDGNCSDCDVTCRSCTGPADNECQMCDYDRFLSDENRCIEVCSPGYYPDYEDNICRPCHSSCKTCLQDGPEECMDCRDGMYILYNEYGVYCVDQCPEGYYRLDEGPVEDTSQTCQLCSPKCLDCSGSYSHCISCLDNTFLFRDQCIPNCPEDFVEDTESNRCLIRDRLCPQHCTSCNEWGECLECMDGYDMYQGACMQSGSLCQDGQYLLLDSSNNRLCRDCTAHCIQCLGPRTDECIECAADYQLSNGHCRQNCNAKQFDQNGICVECHPSCERCNGPSPYECTACPDDMFHTTGDSGQGECSVGCPQGTYRSDNQCLACTDTCLACDGSGPNNCLSCRAHFFLTGDQQCVQSCPDGTYHFLNGDDSGSPNEFECRPCQSSCSTCYGPLETDCTTCHDSMYRLEHECVAHCGTGYYPGAQAVCQPCHLDCLSCWGNKEDQCITCASGKKLLDSRCVDDCPSDRYLSADFGAVCKQCHVRCKTCFDMGPFNCLSCHVGYELEDNVCYSRCNLGTYYVNHTKLCKPCDSNCEECYGPTDKHCIACHAGQSLSKVDDTHFACLRCCQSPDKGNCCQCNKDGQCVSSPGSDNSKEPVSQPELNHGAIVVVCLLVVAVFGLFFGLLQARSRKKLCWKNTYEQLPAFYHNKTGEEPKITLRQNALPSSDEDDYFDDSDADI